MLQGVGGKAREAGLADACAASLGRSCGWLQQLAAWLPPRIAVTDEALLSTPPAGPGSHISPLPPTAQNNDKGKSIVVIAATHESGVGRAHS